MKKSETINSFCFQPKEKTFQNQIQHCYRKCFFFITLKYFSSDFQILDESLKTIQSVFIGLNAGSTIKSFQQSQGLGREKRMLLQHIFFLKCWKVCLILAFYRSKTDKTGVNINFYKQLTHFAFVQKKTKTFLLSSKFFNPYYLFFLSQGMIQKVVADSTIKMYIELKRYYYVAGGSVEGNIYVEVKEKQNYWRLILRLKGQEHVPEILFKNIGKKKNPINYKSHFVVQEFGEYIDEGYYKFPFMFILPEAMSGSFFESEEYCILYTLQAILNHTSNAQKSKCFEKKLTILQIPKVKNSKIELQKYFFGTHCLCCVNSGDYTAIRITCDKKVAKNNEAIKVGVIIDNEHGMTKINGGHVKLVKKRFPQEKLETIISLIGKIDPTPAGKIKIFEFEKVIPNNLQSGTVFGRSIAVYFEIVVELKAKTQIPPVRAHIFIQNQNPKIFKPENYVPKQQNVKEFTKLCFSKIKPFIYKPDSQIPYQHEMTQKAKAKRKTEGVQPYFENCESKDTQMIRKGSESNDPYQTMQSMETLEYVEVETNGKLN